MNGIPTAATSAVAPLPDGWHVVRFNILAGSRLAILGANVDILGAWQSDLAGKTTGGAWRAAAKATGRVWTLDSDNLIECVEFPLLEPFPIIEQFPDGRWLVTRVRSEGQGNACVLESGGEEKQRFELGHGIGHLKIDVQARIWVGWIDEGVFGNEHWRMAGHRWPPSAYGIAAFDDSGALLMHATSRAIADCYALNVSGSAAWACTYSGFPIWKMGDDPEQVWSTALSGTRALAVSYPFVLAAGGYQDAANRVVLLRLGESEATSRGEWRLPFGVGYPDEVSLIDGRDDELHVVHDQQWYRWRVREFIRLRSP